MPVPRVIALTAPMARDLRFIVALHERTVGTFDYPHGQAERLRTGRALERRGLVRCANATSANAHQRWSPTEAGLQYVKQNFAGRVDAHREQAAAKAQRVAP